MWICVVIELELEFQVELLGEDRGGNWSPIYTLSEHKESQRTRDNRTESRSETNKQKVKILKVHDTTLTTHNERLNFSVSLLLRRFFCSSFLHHSVIHSRVIFFPTIFFFLPRMSSVCVQVDVQVNTGLLMLLFVNYTHTTTTTTTTTTTVAT
ncbi:hypothetical protein GQ42DRAFT_81 [Ramicandelaber brevisporus]|nr:hypothetical protein GQ42DRAFT_81 [Ramicandelaber brevisporus]